MNMSRRDLFKKLALGSGAVLLSPMVHRIVANAEGKSRAPRFVFVLQSNGFDAIQACPESIPFQKYADRDKFERIDLTKHTLPKGLAPLEPLKKHGFSDVALLEIVHITGYFNYINRLADELGVDPEPEWGT